MIAPAFLPRPGPGLPPQQGTGASGPVGPHPAHAAAYVNRVAHAQMQAAALAAAAAVYQGAHVLGPTLYPAGPNPFYGPRVVPVVPAPPGPHGTVSTFFRRLQT